MADEERDLSGQVIDARYRVEYRIGQGGMGVVWRVRHVQSRQLLALKTMHSTGSRDRIVLRRLLHEARATAAIQSSNVVRIIDVKSDYVHDGVELPFIVMEFLEGETFAVYLESVRTIDTGELVWVMRQVSHGLSLAHQRGIIHRDLKPSNVFLSKNDDGNVAVKLCDFGIAKLQGKAIVELKETGTLSTETGALFGTPHYMAPEQLRRPGSEGSSTDQWAFGLIVFRAIAGRSYFEGARNSTALLLAIVHEPLPEPSSLSPLVPPALDAWFLRSFARNPAERFANIETQQQELERALGWPEVKPIEIKQSRSVRISSSNPPSRRNGGSFNAQNRRARTHAALFYMCLGVATLTSVIAANWLATRLKNQSTIPADSRRAFAGRAASGIAPEPKQPPNGSAPTKELVANLNPSAPLQSKQATLPSTTPANMRHVQGTDSRTSPNTPTIMRSLLPRGAPCVWSAQCQDGLCAAEACQ